MSSSIALPAGRAPPPRAAMTAPAPPRFKVRYIRGVGSADAGVQIVTCNRTSILRISTLEGVLFQCASNEVGSTFPNWMWSQRRNSASVCNISYAVCG